MDVFQLFRPNLMKKQTHPNLGWTEDEEIFIFGWMYFHKQDARVISLTHIYEPIWPIKAERLFAWRFTHFSGVIGLLDGFVSDEEVQVIHTLHHPPLGLIAHLRRLLDGDACQEKGMMGSERGSDGLRGTLIHWLLTRIERWRANTADDEDDSASSDQRISFTITYIYCLK